MLQFFRRRRHGKEQDNRPFLVSGPRWPKRPPSHRFFMTKAGVTEATALRAEAAPKGQRE